MAQPQGGPSWTGLAYPVLRAITPERAGLGAEATANRKGNVTLEPYGKAFWALPNNFGVAVKFKYSPRADFVKFEGGDTNYLASTRETFSNIRATFFKDANGNRNLRGMLPQKVSMDFGLVVARNYEVGGTVEYKNLSLRPSGSFAYGSLKDKYDPLLSTAQIKAGKAQGKQLFSGLLDAMRSRQSDFWPTAKSMEVQFSTETKLSTGDAAGVSSSALGTATVKTTLGEAVQHTSEVLKAPPPPGTTATSRFAGFTAGTAASFGGDYLAHQLGSDKIHDPVLRHAVNASAAATAGVVADHVMTHNVPKVPPLIGQVASKLRVAAASSKLASPVASLASRVRWAGVGSTALKVGRIGGPAGAVLAGVPDGVNAYQSFKAGDNAAGATSAVKAGVKVGATLAGAVIGQGLIPIPGVGAAVGAVVGGVVGELATSGTMMKTYSAIGDGVVNAGKWVAGLLS
jgi:hypothetical protein